MRLDIVYDGRRALDHRPPSSYSSSSCHMPPTRAQINQDMQTDKRALSVPDYSPSSVMALEGDTGQRITGHRFLPKSKRSKSTMSSAAKKTCDDRLSLESRILACASRLFAPGLHQQESKQAEQQHASTRATIRPCPPASMHQQERRHGDCAKLLIVRSWRRFASAL